MKNVADRASVQEIAWVHADGGAFHQTIATESAVQRECLPHHKRGTRCAEAETEVLIHATHVADDDKEEYRQQSTGEEEEVLRLEPLELHRPPHAFIDLPRSHQRKKLRKIVAATIRKIHAPNHEAAVFDVSGSPEESSRSAPLLGLSPLRTVRDTFASYGSSNTRK